MEHNKNSYIGNFLAKYVGLLIAAGAIILVELLHNSTFRIEFIDIDNPSPILFLPIVFTAFVGGMRQGIIVAIIASIYSLHLFYVLEKHQFSPVAIQNVTILSVVSIVMALMVGIMAENQKKLARTDALTGLANRRHFFNAAGNELNRARRYGQPISIAYIDVDNFKAINDSIGHSAGDALLRLVAQTIMTNIRKVDIAARLGGDEFALLLPETSAEPALYALQRLEKELMELMNKNEWLVTFSIGVATFTSAPASVDEMINTADSIMYNAKHSGKNTIKQEIYPPQRTVSNDVPSLRKHS